jgi:DNA-binding CsgD family transcriptional regulator
MDTEAAALRLRSASWYLDLSPREHEVLQLFAAGLGTSTIATRLAISRVTVRNHAQRILTKLGAHSRLEAVAMGYSLGLIEITRPEGPAIH